MSYYSSQSRPSRSRERGDAPSSRSRSESRPPLPTNPRTQSRAGPPRTGREAYPSSRSLSGSTTASSSSGSSLLDRMKAPSSRTSMEEDYERPKRDERSDRRREERSRREDRRRDYDARSEGSYDRRRDDDSRSEGYRRRKDYDSRSERGSRNDRDDRRRDYDNRDDRYERRGTRSRAQESRDVEYEREDYRDDRSDAPPPEEGHGYDLWGRLTSVASKLTINVSQAWERSIQSADGEITPPGEESRLTKALKAYHLAKARSPSDLPPWLFAENERGGGRTRSRARSRSEAADYEDRFHPDNNPEPPRSRGFRDIYDNAAKPSVPSSTASEAGASRATDRLRQIRDAKRSAAQTGPRSASVDERPRTVERTVRAPPAPPRGGLPSRPRAY